MSFIRVSNPVATPVSLDDLGYEVGASVTNLVLTDQFTIDDLYVSADLEAAIIGGSLTVEIDYGTGFAAVAAGDYTNRDAMASFLNVYELTNENNNEDLVDGSDASSLHTHDSRYYTETEVSGTGGAGLTGVDQTNFDVISGTTVQAVLDSVDDALAGFDLDDVYTNDTDGILNVNGVGKILNFKSDNINDIMISRTNGSDDQNALVMDVSANELLLGALASGGLAEMDVRILSDLYINGNLTYTGTITDESVTHLDVTNGSIMLRDGATVGADANIFVERGTTGDDASILWNETLDRWQFGLVGAEKTPAMIELNEVILGIWTFGGGATDPDYYMTEKLTEPTTNLGVAGQIPMVMGPNGIMMVYDKSNARDKFLSVSREYMVFSGRNNSNNTNEYMRIGELPVNNAGNRVIRNATIVGIAFQTKVAETWIIEVRKNGLAAPIYSKSVSAVDGGQDHTVNVDIVGGDELQLFINGSQIDRPVVKLEIAYRY